MSTVRRCLKNPRFWLIAFGVIYAGATADSFRAPSRQITGATYCWMVGEYQHFGRRVLKGHVQCRFEPTCSVYSVEAVHRLGIRRGLALTVNRLSRCNDETPLGTVDPVPAE